MKKISAREYATKHRLSLYQVIKEIQSGKLKGEAVEENGRNIQYVFVSDDPAAPSPQGSSRPASGETPPADVPNSLLLRELKQLRREIELLRREIHAMKRPGTPEH